jgi:hypothetical protein
VQALLRVARTDSDGDVRAFAMRLLTDLWRDENQPALREVVVPLILLTALEGPAESRREAIMSFEDIGVAAANTSHALLREGGLDEDLAYYAVRPLLDAGRINDLMATELTWEIAQAVVSWLQEHENDGGERKRVATCAPHAQKLIGACRGDDASGFIYMLLTHGYLDITEKIALRTDLDSETQQYALVAMFAGDTVPEAMQEEQDTRALRVLAAYLDPRLSELTRRRLTVSAAAWDSSDIGSERLFTRVLAILENTARGDPNSWVRGIAQEAVETLNDSYEW